MGECETHPSMPIAAPVAVDTFSGRVHVEWDPQAAVTPLGQLPFFTEFLQVSGLFDPWVANALLLTAPGIPMLFMGQEILEDKYWSDNPSYHTDTLVWWDGLAQQPEMREHLRFMQDIIRLRRTRPGLTGRNSIPFQVHNDDRVLVTLRGTGDGADDIVVIVSLNESVLRDYAVGFPHPGTWYRHLNGDDYEIDPTRRASDIGVSIEASGPAMHTMPASARIAIPANGVLIFGRKPR